MPTLILKVATVSPSDVSFIAVTPISAREATQRCAAAQVDQRAIPPEAIVTGDVKVCFGDESGPWAQFPVIAFPAANAPEAIESLFDIPADQVSLFVACGKVVAEMMQEGRSDAEIDHVLMRLERETQEWPE